MKELDKIESSEDQLWVKLSMNDLTSITIRERTVEDMA